MYLSFILILILVIAVLCGIIYAITKKSNLSLKEKLISFFVNNIIIKKLLGK